MKIYLLRQLASEQQVADMLEALGDYIKLAVDIKYGIAAGGGALHADCEAVLLAEGSSQEDIWGADWIPATHQIRCEALINIRPRQNNRSMNIENPAIRNRISEIVEHLLVGK